MHSWILLLQPIWMRMAFQYLIWVSLFYFFIILAHFQIFIKSLCPSVTSNYEHVNQRTKNPGIDIPYLKYKKKITEREPIYILYGPTPRLDITLHLTSWFENSLKLAASCNQFENLFYADALKPKHFIHLYSEFWVIGVFSASKILQRI